MVFLIAPLIIGDGAADFIVFTDTSNDICKEIHKGSAEIMRILSVKARDSFGLRKLVDKNHLYGMNLEKNQQVYLFFNSSIEKPITMSLTVHFQTERQLQLSKDLITTSEVLDTSIADVFAFKLRDRSSNLPVSGKVKLEGSKKINGLYTGSDFKFSIFRRLKLNLTIDALGYFYQDKTIFLETGRDKQLTIWLEPAKPGKKIQLKGIHFQVGTSSLTPGAEQHLSRLLNFLQLNSTIHIEIEGHVHELGRNSFAGRRMSTARAEKRMSTARAEKVQNYLLENGIKKERMKAIGYGNERMIYPEPKYTWQEQANRRVEIKIVSDE